LAGPFCILISLFRTISIQDDTIFINEVHYQNTGPDVTEFVEVAFVTGYSLAGVRLLFYDGGTGSVYKTTNLATDLSISDDDPANGFTFASYSVYSFQNQVRNGPDAIALVDGSDTIIDFISYGGEVTASDGPAFGQTARLMEVVEASNANPTSSLQLGGSGFRPTEFTWQGSQTATPASVNSGQTITCPNSAIGNTPLILSSERQSVRERLDGLEIVPPSP